MKNELIEKYIGEGKYLNEAKTTKVKTEKNQTGHIHNAEVNDNGDGKTTSTSTGPDHVHKVFEWIVQPAKGHIHNLEI